MNKKPTVAILGDHKDIVSIMRLLLEPEGYNIVSGSTDAFIDGKKDIKEFLDRNSPGALLVNIPLPATEYIDFVENMRRLEEARNTSIILMSIGEKEVRKHLDPSTDWEILELPLENIDEVAAVVKRSLEKREEPSLTRGERGY